MCGAGVLPHAARELEFMVTHGGRVRGRQRRDDNKDSSIEKDIAVRRGMLSPASNEDGCVTKPKLNDVYERRHTLLDGISRATDATTGGKCALECGYGDVDQGCTYALSSAGARVAHPRE